MTYVNIKIHKSIFKNISNEICNILNENLYYIFIGKFNTQKIINTSFYICKNKTMWNEFGEYEHVNSNTLQYIKKGYNASDYTGYMRLVNYYDYEFIIELLIKNGKLVSYEILSLPSINYNIITKFY
jgi:hypothetical protein